MIMKLSVITINLNDADGLQKTLSSVWERQSFSDFEHIVIDGASTDGSVEVIKEYADRLAYWVSEPDKGIYSAMNKGIVRARGEYLLFINSGDWLADDVLAKVFAEPVTDDIVYGNFTYVKRDGTLLPVEYKRPLTYTDLLIYSIGHPSSFIKRTLFDGGLYNEEFRIVSDWAFFVTQIIKNGCSVKRIGLNIAFFNDYGISLKPEMATLTENEHRKFLTENFDRCFCGLYDSARERECVFGYITKARTQEFLDSSWMQHYTRKCIKVLFWLKKILGIKR